MSASIRTTHTLPAHTTHSALVARAVKSSGLSASLILLTRSFTLASTDNAVSQNGSAEYGLLVQAIAGFGTTGDGGGDGGDGGDGAANPEVRPNLGSVFVFPSGCR